jgi:hypothetical protein
MDIFATYATDETKEVEGVVVFLGTGKNEATDPWIRVARMQNDEFTKEFAAAHARLQVEKNELKLSDAEMEIRGKNNMIDLMAKTILKGFGNLSFQGKPLTYSHDSALMLLRVKDFRELVASKASDFELYRAQHIEAAKGN